MDGSQGGMTEAPLSAADVRRFLSDNPEFLTADQGLLDELGLKVAQGNVVDFGPAALARVHAAHLREATQRREIEETARANFSAGRAQPFRPGAARRYARPTAVRHRRRADRA